MAGLALIFGGMAGFVHFFGGMAGFVHFLAGWRDWAPPVTIPIQFDHFSYDISIYFSFCYSDVDFEPYIVIPIQILL